MNPITEVREDLATTLNEAGIRTFGYAAEKLVPPCAAIDPHDEYITLREGDRFGNYNIAVRILILGPRASEKVAAEQMDDLILKALRALNEDFDVVSVSAPGRTQLGSTEVFAAIIEVEVQINLGKDN